MTLRIVIWCGNFLFSGHLIANGIAAQSIVPDLRWLACLFSVKELRIWNHVPRNCKLVVFRSIAKYWAFWLNTAMSTSRALNPSDSIAKLVPRQAPHPVHGRFISLFLIFFLSLFKVWFYAIWAIHHLPVPNTAILVMGLNDALVRCFSVLQYLRDYVLSNPKVTTGSVMNDMISTALSWVSSGV